MERTEDRTYFLLRAQTERAFASTCEDNIAALAHFRLADEYDRRASALSERASTVSEYRR